MHLSENRITRFINGGLDPEELEETERHLDECSECLQCIGQAARKAYRAPDEGTRVGRYVLEQELGSGAMGTVFAAYDPELDRRVAIKRLKSAPSAEHRARLQREAQTMARLHHPNIATVYDLGEDDKGLYFAMQLVEGSTLSRWLSARPRSAREILSLFIAAGEGLAAAHSAGIVHRDFKPPNVLVNASDVPVVTDFGLARAATTEELTPQAAPARAWHHDLTQTGTTLGTPAYMAPEQHRGQPADASADQFAFCVTLFEAITGKRPFAGRTSAELVGQILTTRPSFPKDSAVPSGLRSILLRGLSADRNARYPSMSALVAALRKVRARPRRLMALSVGACLAVLFALGGYVAAHAQEGNCDTPPKALIELWSESNRASVRQAFASTQKPYAAKAFDSIDNAFKGFVSAARQQRTEACVATHRRQQQTHALLERRLGCLDDRVAEAGFLVRILFNADEGVVLSSGPAAQKILRLEDCSNVAALLARPETPKEGPVAEAVVRLQPMLGEFRALFSAGKQSEATVLGEKLIQAASALGTHPLHAEIFLRVADTQMDMRQLDAAKNNYHQAELLADSAGADPIRVLAILGDAMYLGSAGQREASLERLGQAESISRRTPKTTSGQVRLHSLRALLLSWALRYEESLEAARESLQVARKETGENSHFTARAYVTLGGAYAQLSRFDEARPELSTALTLFERIYGPTHPDVGRLLGQMAEIEMRALEPTRAVELALRSIAVIEAASGPNSPTLEMPLYALASARKQLGRPPNEVLPMFARGRQVAASTRSGPGPNIVLSLSLEAAYRAQQISFESAKPVFEQACDLATKFFEEENTVSHCWMPYFAASIDAGSVAESRRLLERVKAGMKAGLKPTRFDSDSTQVEFNLQLARFRGKHGAAKEAVESLTELLNEYRSSPIRVPAGEAEIQLALAKALSQQRQFGEARALAEAAKAVFVRHGFKHQEEAATQLLRAGGGS